MNFAKDLMPDVHTVLFVPSVYHGGLREGAPFLRGIWPSIDELAATIMRTLDELDADDRERILLLDADTCPDIPPVCSLNLVTGSSFVFGEVACACVRPQLATIEHVVGSPCADLKQLVQTEIDAEHVDPCVFERFQDSDNVFGCLQMATHLRNFGYPSHIIDPYDTYPTYAAPSMKHVCAILYPGQVMFSPLVSVADTATKPAKIWKVYGRYRKDDLDAKYPGLVLTPCPHTIAVIQFLRDRGETVDVVEVANARDPDVPASKPLSHTTVPVVFTQLNDEPLLFIGGRDTTEANFET